MKKKTTATFLMLSGSQVNAQIWLHEGALDFKYKNYDNEIEIKRDQRDNSWFGLDLGNIIIKDDMLVFHSDGE
jgi:hypothetical protein